MYVKDQMLINVHKVEHVFHKNMYSVHAPARSYQSDGDRFSSTRGFDSFLGFRQMDAVGKVSR